MVANLVTYFAMRERAAEFGMTRDMLDKNEAVIDGGLRSLEICKKAGVKVGFGSDLLGQLHAEQSREFLFRREVHAPIEIVRQATLIGAEIVRMEGKLGVVQPGALADLIVVDGDPLKKLELFLNEGAHIPLIMKAGRIHKNALG
jgi:imidazolonepropionase-like amidohydrolase